MVSSWLEYTLPRPQNGVEATAEMGMHRTGMLPCLNNRLQGSHILYQIKLPYFCDVFPNSPNIMKYISNIYFEPFFNKYWAVKPYSESQIFFLFIAVKMAFIEAI